MQNERKRRKRPKIVENGQNGQFFLKPLSAAAVPWPRRRWGGRRRSGRAATAAAAVAAAAATPATAEKFRRNQV